MKEIRMNIIIDIFIVLKWGERWRFERLKILIIEEIDD